jgi:hypothetical protein
MRRLAIVCFAASVLIMGYWYFGSEPRHLATLTKTLVQPKGVDDFGDPLPKEWVPVFEPGLDIYGGTAGGFAFIGGILFLVARRRESST